MIAKASTKAVALIALAAIIAASFCIVPISETDAETGFVITDSTGKQSSYDAPSDQIMVFGYAATLTLIDAGATSKIYATDQYGQQAFVDKGITDLPKIFKTAYNDASQLKSNIIGSVDDGFDKEKGTVILTTFATVFVGADKNSGLRGELLDIGFSHVLFYGSIYEYDDVVDVVKDLELVSGSSADLASGMIATKERVQKAVEGLEKKDAVFLRYSSVNGWGIGTSGSIGGALISTAGGNNLGLEIGSTSTVYDVSKILEILEKSPEAVIFMDNAYFDTYGGTFEKFVEDFFHGDLGDLKLVKMQKTWNNYDPESAEGLVEMAHVLHPDAVDGTVEPYTQEKNAEGSDWTLAVIGIAVVLAICIAVGFAVIRKRKSV